MKTLCTTPSKIILTGEHAVVYGAPSLSMAVDLTTVCEMEFTESDANEVPFIEIELTDYSEKHAFPFSIWQKLAIHIETRFQLFEAGAASINSVLKQPIDLVLATLHHYHHHFQIKPGHWNLKIQGHGFIGKGLGSSAAIVVSVLHSLFIQHRRQINETELLALAKAVESRQHGSSSGLDPSVILLGGLLNYQQSQPLISLEAKPFHGWLVDTGAPEASTGQVVSYVRDQFGNSHPIWKDFALLAEKMIDAWDKQDGITLKRLVNENQLLLEEIGIVPEKVKRFIKAAQQNGVAAKVCGAGSHLGEHSGFVLCLSEQAPLELCNQYGYNCIAIHLNSEGSHCEVVV